MKINRFSLLSGAKLATGLTVIIDVFRAFTTGAYVVANGVERIYPVATVNEAFELKKQHQDWILIGEQDGEKVPGFNYGNSPYEIIDVDFSGHSVIQTTSAGTRGLFNAYEADEILPGSFVMADAIVKYITKKRPKVVSLVAMGWGGYVKSPEDESLAEYIEQKLRGENPDYESMKNESENTLKGQNSLRKIKKYSKKKIFTALWI